MNLLRFFFMILKMLFVPKLLFSPTFLYLSGGYWQCELLCFEAQQFFFFGQSIYGSISSRLSCRQRCVLFSISGVSPPSNLWTSAPTKPKQSGHVVCPQRGLAVPQALNFLCCGRSKAPLPSLLGSSPQEPVARCSRPWPSRILC